MKHHGQVTIYLGEINKGFRNFDNIVYAAG